MHLSQQFPDLVAEAGVKGTQQTAAEYRLNRFVVAANETAKKPRPA